MNKFTEFWKSNIYKSDEETKWITVGGKHIPIKPGQSKDQAVKEHMSSQNKKKPSESTQSDKKPGSKSKDSNSKTFKMPKESGRTSISTEEIHNELKENAKQEEEDYGGMSESELDEIRYNSDEGSDSAYIGYRDLLKDKKLLNKDGTITLYHSTSADSKKIQSQGLKPKLNKINDTYGTYFTTTPNSSFGDNMVEVHVPATELGNFRLDEDMEEAGNVIIGYDALKEGSVRYEGGNILPEWIEKIHNKKK